MFFRSFLLSLPLVALLAGCGLNLGGVSVELDDALETELRTLARTDGATTPLVELFPGDWDTVHVVLGPKTEEQIEDEIGRFVKLDGDGTYRDTFMQDGNLLVFMTSGEIVRMVGTGQLAVVPTGVFPSDAIMHSGDGSIRILNPDGSQARQGKPWPVVDR